MVVRLLCDRLGVSWRRLALLAAGAVVLSGCGVVHVHLGAQRSGTGPVLHPPQIVRARRLAPAGPGALRSGTRVGSDFSGTRAFVDPKDGFAIGTPPRTADTYPLATVDGGKSWHVAGPVLHIPAAQAPVGVAQAGMITPRVWYACCGLNTVVDVTPDAGRHWWQAFLPGEVLAVYPGPSVCGRLIAVVQPFSKGKPPPLWTYASSSGRRWVYVPNPNNEPACR
jgi:hypothetical protein